MQIAMKFILNFKIPGLNWACKEDWPRLYGDLNASYLLGRSVISSAEFDISLSAHYTRGLLSIMWCGCLEGILLRRGVLQYHSIAARELLHLFMKTRYATV